MLLRDKPELVQAIADNDAWLAAVTKLCLKQLKARTPNSFAHITEFLTATSLGVLSCIMHAAS